MYPATMEHEHRQRKLPHGKHLKSAVEIVSAEAAQQCKPLRKPGDALAVVVGLVMSHTASELLTSGRSHELWAPVSVVFATICCSGRALATGQTCCSTSSEGESLTSNTTARLGICSRAQLHNMYKCKI